MPVEDAPLGVVDAVRSRRVLLVESSPAAEAPAAMLDEPPAFAPRPDEEPAVPKAVLADPLPAVAPPALKLEDVSPFAPAEEAPAPRAALACPLFALAAPTPRLEPVPALPEEEPAVPNAVLALLLPEVDAPEPTVEAL
jgi:hypothetical protein